MWLSQKVTKIDQSELKDGKLYLQKWDDGWWPVLYTIDKETKKAQTQAKNSPIEKVEEGDTFAEFIVYGAEDQIMFTDEKYTNKVATILDTTAEGHYKCFLESDDADEEFDPDNISLAASLKGKQTDMIYDVKYNSRIMLYDPNEFETVVDLSWFDDYVVEPVWSKHEFKEKLKTYETNSNFLDNGQDGQEQLVSHVTAALDFNSQKYQRDLRGRQNRIGLLNVVQEYLAQKTDQLVAMWKKEIETMRERQYKSFKKSIRDHVREKVKKEKIAKLKSFTKPFLKQDEFNAWMEECWEMQIKIQNTTRDNKIKAKEKFAEWMQQKLFETKSRMALSKFKERQETQTKLKPYDNTVKTDKVRIKNVKKLLPEVKDGEAKRIANKLNEHSEDKNNALLYPKTRVWEWWKDVNIPFPLFEFYKEERAWYDRCVNASVELDFLKWRKENEERVKQEKKEAYTGTPEIKKKKVEKWFKTTKAKMVKKELRKYIENGGDEVSFSQKHVFFEGDDKYYFDYPFRVLKHADDKILRYIAQHLNESYRVRAEGRLNFTPQEFIDMADQLLKKKKTQPQSPISTAAPGNPPEVRRSQGVSSALAPAVAESRDFKKRKAEREINKETKRKATFVRNIGAAGAASAAGAAGAAGTASAAGAASVANAANQGKRGSSSAAGGPKKKSRKKLHEMFWEMKLRF